MRREVRYKRRTAKVIFIKSKENNSKVVSILKLAPPILLVVVTTILAYYTYQLAKFSSTQSKASISAAQAAKKSAEATLKSLGITEKSLKYAEEANRLEKEASNKTEKFAIINAEVQWDSIRESYDKIDQSLKEWEKNKNFKMNGKIIRSRNELDKELKELKAPDHIKHLYIKRFNKYQIMENLAKQYKPFSQRLTHIDLTLPAPPRLPRGGGATIKYNPHGAIRKYNPHGAIMRYLPPITK